MRYMFLVYSQEQSGVQTPEEIRDLQNRHNAVMEEARAKGILLGADPLLPTATAKTVRTQNGSALITDGPFAETKEQLAGYYLLECKDLSEALGWAKRIPTACKGGEGCIEIRAVLTFP